MTFVLMYSQWASFPMTHAVKNWGKHRKTLCGINCTPMHWCYVREGSTLLFSIDTALQNLAGNGCIRCFQHLRKLQEKSKKAEEKAG
jgi:hypothetical protein